MRVKQNETSSKTHVVFRSSAAAADGGTTSSLLSFSVGLDQQPQSKLKNLLHLVAVIKHSTTYKMTFRQRMFLCMKPGVQAVQGALSGETERQGKKIIGLLFLVTEMSESINAVAVWD